MPYFSGGRIGVPARRRHDDRVQREDLVPRHVDRSGGRIERRTLELESDGAAAVHGQVKPVKNDSLINLAKERKKPFSLRSRKAN